MQSCVFIEECLPYLSHDSLPKVFVETGTYMGHGVDMVKNSFRQVHSIELKQEFFDTARLKFDGDNRITIHLGDSAEVLASLCESIKESVIFYLDAHYSGGETAFGKEEDKGCPVLRELEVIGKRPYDDIVFVDDMRLMGKASMSGTEGDKIYPLTFFDFTHATVENMMAKYNKPCKTYQCRHFDRMLIIPDQKNV